MLRLLNGRRGVRGPNAREAEPFAQAAFPHAHVLRTEPVKTGGGDLSSRLFVEIGPSPLLLRVYAADPEACAREAAVLRAIPRVVPVPAVYASSLPASSRSTACVPSSMRLCCPTASLRSNGVTRAR
ncbi:MAG TPA: hypothetical protein VF337_09790 [Candidatus Limnocylindrales bacterium]